PGGLKDPAPEGSTSGIRKESRPAVEADLASLNLSSRNAEPASYTVKELDLASMMKFSSAFALFSVLVSVVAAAVLFVAGAAAGINDSVEEFLRSLWSPDFRMSAGGVLRWTALLALIGAGAFTLLTMVGALIYNLVCDLTGGIRVVVAGDRTKMDREGP
ncbi:MAG: DUF3566 domain-containing protein, partial [Actinomycetota bacterium]